MTQRFLHVLAPPNHLGRLSRALQDEGFAVVRGLGGLYIRVRVGTDDAGRVEGLVHWTSRQAVFEAPVAPAEDLADYRVGQ